MSAVISVAIVLGCALLAVAAWWRQKFRRRLAAPAAPTVVTTNPPAPERPKRFLEKMGGEIAAEAACDARQTALVLQYFATDSCERMFLLEKHIRQNEAELCFQILEETRRRISEGNRAEHAAEILRRVAVTAKALTADDPKRILFAGLEQLTIANEEEMADRAFLFTMLRLVRYGGPFVDQVRHQERLWHDARLTWWLQQGVRLADPLAAYRSEATLVSEQARMLSGIKVKAPAAG